MISPSTLGRLIAVSLSVFLSVATLHAQHIKTEIFQTESAESTNNDYVSEHVTVYPAENAGDRNTSCSCWVDPDDTYTEADIVIGQGANIMDDGSTNNLPFPFNLDLFGTTYSSFWININGHITFDQVPSDFYVEADFPINRTMMAPAFADVDMSCATCGQIFYKVTTDAVYINWIDAGYFPASSDQVNNFQIIFTSSSSTLLGDGNNVQFCYKDMQWVDTQSSTTIETGVSAGNGTDFIQFGIFEAEGNADYDGPFGANDGVDWLDDKAITFNSSLTSNDNTPPISVGASECDTITLCIDDIETVGLTFLAPEDNQSVNITVDDGGFPNIVTQTDPGSTANTELTFSSVGVTPGVYNITVTAFDNGTPSESTDINLVVEVINFALPDLDVYFENEIVNAVTFCQGQGNPLLAGTDGFECYEWSNGSMLQEDNFTQGEYALTAHFMGCETTSDTVSVFAIPAFNPDIISEDDFVCSGDSTELSLVDPELYSDINWSVFNGGGTILSPDLTATSISVTNGSYVVTVLDDNGCEGSRIIALEEEIFNLPQTNLADDCGEHEFNWSGAWADPEECTTFLYLNDSEGDEWEGANIEVFVDGTGPLNFNISNSATFLPTGVTAFHGQTIEYYFTSGLDDDDISIQIFNCNNQIIFDSENPGDDLTEGLFFTQQINAGFNALTGSWTQVPDVGTFSDPGVFNPVNGTQTFTVPDDFLGIVSLEFTGDICDLVVPIELVFSAEPTVELTTDPIIGCSNENIEIIPVYGPEDLPNASYNWTSNDFGNETGPTVIATESGSYCIEYETDNCGSDEACGEVIITAIPVVNLTGGDICDNESLTLSTGNTAPGIDCVWTPGGETTSSITVNNGGTYSVICSNECGSDNGSVTVNQAFSPTVSGWGDGDSLICPGDVVQIDPTWSNGNNLVNWNMTWVDSLGQNQSLQFSESGEVLSFGSDQIPQDALFNEVNITYSTANGCGSADNTITVYTSACFIEATNIITPDSDGDANGTYSGGLNEAWHIVGIENIANVHVRIYNRWGGLVFEDTNYKNSNPWRGQHTNGIDLEQGVYFFTINTPREKDAFGGSITLLRK